MVTTAFGKAEIAEEVTLKQRVNGKQFSTLVQLLEDDKGEWLIRFAYATDGVARRGPVTLRGSDVERCAWRCGRRRGSRRCSAWLSERFRRGTGS